MEFERSILLDTGPPPEILDAKGMEAAIASDRETAGMVDGGMSAIGYALEWAERAPAEMFSWLMRRGPVSLGWLGDERSRFTGILFESWAEHGMEAALAAVAGISNRSIRRQALLSSLEVMGKADVARARELMIENLALFEPDDRDLSFNYPSSGASTCDLLLSLPPGKTRTRLLAKLLNNMVGWPTDEFSGHVHSVWQSAPDSLRRELVAAGFTSDAAHSGSFAGLEALLRERAETSGDPAASESFIKIHGQAWARRDLAGALAWAQDHLKGRNRVDQSAGLFRHAASEDFEAALRIWLTLPEGILKARAAGAMANGAPEDLKPEADALLESLSPSDRKQARQTRY